MYIIDLFGFICLLRFFVTSTEFALLTHGFSQNWLNASAMGLEE